MRYRWNSVAFLVGVAVVLGGFGAVAAGPVIEQVGLFPPSDAVRFYHARVELSASDADYVVTEASLGGMSDVFITLVDGALHQYREDRGVNRGLNGTVPAGGKATFYIRCPWENGETYDVSLKGTAGEALALAASVTAPAEGGFPYPGWTKHRVLVLREDFGIERENEPFLLFLSDEAGNVASWKKELRVAKYDLATGATEEIPSQVLYEKRRFDTPVQQDTYTTCQAAFLTDVPANGKAYYLIAFGNPKAEAAAYETDLTVGKRDDGATWIENAFYELKLHPDCRQIKGFRSKVYGKGDERGFGLNPDNKYALHYNPDVWVKNRSWTHTNGWNPPPNETTESGPVVVVTRRWGHLPRAREVEVEVVYHFFSQAPYCLIESTMDVLQDVVVNALRNEEVVTSPPEEVDHAGWRRPNGELAYKPTTQEPGMTPGMVGIIEPDAPYVCLAREADGLGMASLRLSQHAGSRGDQDPVIASTMTVIADYGWGFRYWSRSQVYPWGDHLVDQPTVLNAGTYYGERSALCLFPLGEGDSPKERLAYLEALYERLSHPVRIDHQGAGPW